MSDLALKMTVVGGVFVLIGIGLLVLFGGR